MSRTAVGVAGVLGLSGVALGAFGAHGLRERLGAAMLDVYRTGVLYHLVHALAALVVALAADRLRRAPVIVTFFALGVLVFSGSLYALAITRVSQLGAVTPIGGLCFMVGWVLVIGEALPKRAR
jgi:uncharacterized membrane protein YgdD (TMEM256/DUF423 family)